MVSALEMKIAMGIEAFKVQRVPENSCIALEIEKIGKKLRIRKAQRSDFRVGVYYGWRKIKNPSDSKRKVFDPMDVHESGSLPSETGSSAPSETGSSAPSETGSSEPSGPSDNKKM